MSAVSPWVWDCGVVYEFETTCMRLVKRRLLIDDGRLESCQLRNMTKTNLVVMTPFGLAVYFPDKSILYQYSSVHCQHAIA